MQGFRMKGADVMKRALVVGLIAVVAGTGCCWIMGGKKAPTYGDDLAFLKKHTIEEPA